MGIPDLESIQTGAPDDAQIVHFGQDPKITPSQKWLSRRIELTVELAVENNELDELGNTGSGGWVQTFLIRCAIPMW